jgi:hypothetical protein
MYEEGVGWMGKGNHGEQNNIDGACIHISNILD